MQVRTCWMRIAKRTMRWIAAIAGLVFILVLPQDTEAFPHSKWKRSIDLNDVYHFKVNQQRLPDKVVPTSYNLELQPFIGNDRFMGRVRINVIWTNTTNLISLNVHPHLEIRQSSVTITEGSFEEREKGLPLLDVHLAKQELPTEKKPLLVIHLEEMLKEGSACKVDITFEGKLTTNESSGLFKNEYLDSNGKIHPFVATNLRLDHAQRVFPCMDEPHYKATFKLSVLRPKNMTARSNTPLESSTDAVGKPDQVWDHFEETPLMSTYQVALVVSDFESISPTKEVNEMNGKKLEIKVWSRKEYLDALKDVPDKVVRIMNYLQDYFNSSIELPKLDLMAIPLYSATKASDSWGLMLFKESELSSPSYWNTAYELLYQWIGQLITPYRWSDTPVNKALNSFLASMATVNLNPEEMEGKWPMTILYSLYYEFGKTVPFSRVAGIRNEATSSKKELIFRMFNYTLGEDLFQKGVRNFIQQESNSNQRTFFINDIYNRLNDVANETNSLPPGLTITSIAEPWVTRDRVPLVTVIRDYETKMLSISQKVYLRESLPYTPQASTPKISYQWDIPLVMVSQEKWEFYKPCPQWLTKSNEPKNLTVQDITDKNNFIIVNPEEIGLFPVNYDPCNWKMLSQYLRSPNRETIPALTRAKLLHDSWNLAYAGELCIGIALNMTLSLKEERSHVVWEPVFMMIDHIGRRIEGSDVYPKFEAYILTLLTPLYVELNESVQPNEPSWRTHMRSLAKHFLCRAGYKPCVNEARNQYKKWLTDDDPDKGNPVANEFLCPVFKWGTEEEWEFGLQRVINFPQNSPERKQNERTYLLKSLSGCPKDKYKIKRLLNVTILDQNGNFTDSDIHLIFSTLTGGAAGYTTLFNFLNDHWDVVKQRFKDKRHLWNGIINSATSSFNTQEGLEMVSDLYTTRQGEFDTADHIIEEALKIIKHETEWSEKNLPVIDAWINENLQSEELEVLQTYTTTSVPGSSVPNIYK
ncbi:PREDICTED: aminopeptidase N isoform X1 [Dufourea novaeangliae]|uniref:aminopeptidase N isoform X1 n=1 Tax=Dufourea novaeangliae TaxID=178035 RepID=UPI0007673475|nr:PREDICTED: aminopeptidase N isoform X1 [Dufourea novaeangliae]